jgi:hypothetical protein
MSDDWKIQIRGNKEAQRAMTVAANAVQPQGGLGRAIQFVTLGAMQYAMRVSHIITGALRSSHVPEFASAGNMSRGRVFIDPAAINPMHGKPVTDYAAIEEARGGSHAFYERTVAERGNYLVGRAAELVIAEMPGDT